MTVKDGKKVRQTKVKNYKAESYTGIYGMHKYWSKKPFNVISGFIKRFSNDGEIVVDPFCGSGVSVIESILSGRKAIGIDINPSAIFITEQIIRKVNSEKLKNSFKRIEEKVKVKINNLYTVTRSKENYIATHYVWENDRPIEVWYKDENKNKIIEKPTKSDLALINSFTYDAIEEYYPKGKFFHNPRINAYRDNSLYDLFTPRNLKALAMLMSAIDEEKDIELKASLKFCFTASVGQASKMVFVIKSRGKASEKIVTERKEVGSWVIGYWMPKESFEINAWNCFENRFNKILKAKKEQEKLDYRIVRAEEFSSLIDGNANLILTNEPAQIALQRLPENSVDYIITDPPHGNRIPYLELSMMWNAWLRMSPVYEDEVIVSDAKERGKNSRDYHNLIDRCFEQIQRVLKTNRFFSLMFNSLDDETWIKLISKLHALDFELIRVETLEYSANSVVQDNRKQALKSDFIITFKKNPHKERAVLKIINIDEMRSKAGSLIDTLISKNKNQGTKTYEILNQLFTYFLTRGYFFRISEILKYLNEEYIYQNNKWQKKG